MIYLIGGAPRAGKTILGQQTASRLNMGWISTDLIVHLLQLNNDQGVNHEWNASPEAIKESAEWFFPYLERFLWEVSTITENYLIEGVSFLPAQVVTLSNQYPIRSVFLGCSKMTLESLDQFPGLSPGYAFLPDTQRRRIAQDVPLWSAFIRQECERSGCAYVDTASDFHKRLDEAEAVLINGV